MATLFGRAVARDFLDIYAILKSQRYTRSRLLDLAHAADAGFDVALFADALGALEQVSDTALTAYGATTEVIADVRKLFADWQASIRADL